MLNGQQIDVALFRLIKLMTIFAAPAACSQDERSMAKGADQRHEGLRQQVTRRSVPLTFAHRKHKESPGKLARALRFRVEVQCTESESNQIAVTFTAAGPFWPS